MSYRMRALGQSGTALLELSAASSVLIPVFISALVVIQSLGLSLRLGEILEYAVRSDETIPFRLRTGETGLVRVEIDREGVDRSIGSLAERIESVLKENSPNIASDRYRIEVTVGLVEIEPRSGRASLAHIETRSRVVGGAAVSALDLESTDPLSGIVATAGVVVGDGGASVVARELPGREGGYSPIAPILHVRILRLVDPELVRLLREAIGLQPYVSASEVAVLRAEVGV